MTSQPNMPTNPNAPGFQDRRARDPSGPPGVERRQFANSHDDLSPRAQELAKAIDAYKLRHRRRFITYEEILSVLHSLGYAQNAGARAQQNPAPAAAPAPAQQPPTQQQHP